MTPTPDASRRPRRAFFLAAFATGTLLSVMIHLNGELARHGNALFSSWVAHGTGALAAGLVLVAFRRLVREGAAAAFAPKLPVWAYLGGISGGLTVILTSLTVNSAIGLSGTLALGLAGQVLFGMAADRWGLFGLPRRPIGARGYASLALIVAGGTVIIAAGSFSA